MKKIVVLILILIGAAAFGRAFLTQSVEYETVKVERRDLEISVTASGKIKAVREANLSFGVSGQIEKMASSGATFKKGEVLARLKTDDLWAALQQTYANLNKSRSNFYYYLEIKSQTDSTSAWKEDAVSKALVNQANNNVAGAQDGVEAAQFEVDKARAAYNKGFIKAPFDGLVGQASGKVGEFATAGFGVLTFLDPAAFYFEAELDETDVRYLKIGQTARIKLDVLPASDFAGVVQNVDAAAHTSSSGGTAYNVRVAWRDVFQPDLMVRSGLNGEVKIRREAKKGALMVPSIFINQKSGKATVLRRGSGGPETVEVTLGEFSDGAYEIISGLNAGEFILRPIKK